MSFQKLQRMVLGLFRPSFIQFLDVFDSSTDQRNGRSWAMRMRCCQTRTGLGMFLDFLGRLPKFCNLTCQSVLLEALQALPSRGCQQQISSFKHCRSGELFMIALGKRLPAFSVKHEHSMHALFPGSTRYTLTHSWSGTHRLFSVGHRC